MRKLAFGLALVVGTVMVVTALAIAGEQEIVVLDECDPATFNALLGPGTCVNVGGKVTISTFLAALPTGHPAWLFHPTSLSIKEGETVRATNQGGEVHTFTEVQTFGGGFIGALNNPKGSTPVPECAGGFSNAEVAATRVIQGTSRVVTGLTQGTHHFQCCIHPWMRTDIEVDN